MSEDTTEKSAAVETVLFEDENIKVLKFSFALMRNDKPTTLGGFASPVPEYKSLTAFANRVGGEDKILAMLNTKLQKDFLSKVRSDLPEKPAEIADFLAGIAAADPTNKLITTIDSARNYVPGQQTDSISGLEKEFKSLAEAAKAAKVAGDTAKAAELKAQALAVNRKITELITKRQAEKDKALLDD